MHAQSCLTVCDPMDPPGSLVHGILQARIGAGVGRRWAVSGRRTGSVYEGGGFWRWWWCDHVDALNATGLAEAVNLMCFTN